MDTYQKVKIFKGAIQSEINYWLEKERPSINHTMQSITEGGQLVITIFYY